MTSAEPAAFNTVPCALCEVDDAEPYAFENDHQAVQCRRCGLVYVSPRPSAAAMKALYETSQTHVNLASHLRQRDYKSIQARHCLKVVQRHRPHGRLLEVGSAAGYFLREAQHAGYRVQGLDVTRQFVAFCQDVLNLPAAEGSLADAPFEGGSFDIVYHRNLLSHLHEPVNDFRRIRQLLAPDGIVVFETGNAAELDAARAGRLELPEHLYHFSESTIERLLEKAGFRPIQIQRHGLLMQLELLKAIEGWAAPETPKAKKPTTRALPASLPPTRALDRWRSHAAQLIRYDIGALFGKRLPRATLVVVAERI